MRFLVAHPIGTPGYDLRFLDPAVMTSFVTNLEAAGVDGIGFTEHPAPSRRWLAAGGHESLDPLTALAFCAATTTRIRLVTFLLVLPYRNPLLAAKQVATADLLSGGRLVVAAGAGYLRSEFAALGVDFEQRNELFDEALDVIGSVWAGAAFDFAGRHFSAADTVVVPPPVQRPHPPLWIGGNSRVARRRAAVRGDGWAPMVVAGELSRTARTSAIEGLDDLRSAIADLHRLAEEAGRDPDALDVVVQWDAASSVEADADEAVGLVERLAGAGVTWLVLNPPSNDADRCLDLVATYAEQVISRTR